MRASATLCLHCTVSEAHKKILAYEMAFYKEDRYALLKQFPGCFIRVYQSYSVN